MGKAAKTPKPWQYTIIVTCRVRGCGVEIWRKRTSSATPRRYLTEIRQAFFQHAVRRGYNLHTIRLLGDRVWSWSCWHRSVYDAELGLLPEIEELEAARNGRPAQDGDGYCCCCGQKNCDCQGICFPCDSGGQHCPRHCQHQIRQALLEANIAIMRQRKEG